jgi:1-acyl-sn-glycerol-3-phosphate acyltransferase
MEKSNERENYLVDIEKILGPKLRKKLPRFAINFLKRRLHQDQVNEAIMGANPYHGAGFFDEALKYLNITYRTRGEEKLDKDKKYIFVCNHPLGGPEALIIGSVFHRLYGEGFQVPVTPIMANLKPLAEFFTPVNNLSSKQSRDLGERIAKMFNSDQQVVVFPAGLCARKIKGKITEMPWKKMFVTQARRYERDVVPVHMSGHNSKWYFFLCKLSKFLRLKINIGMLYLVDELFKQRGNEFVITFCEPVPYTTFDKSKTDLQWAAEMQERVKALAEGNGCVPNM